MAMWLFISTSVGALASLGFRAWLVEGKRGGREGGREEGEGWFDVTPMGRVSNRFSHDLQIVDKEVMVGVVRFGDMLLALIGVVVVTVYAVPSLLIAMALALPLSLRLAYSFLSLSQPLKHYEAATRSPVYSHFTEALAGLIVLQDGELVEYDTPLALLNKGPTSLFYRMCEKTGDLPRLWEAAREKEEAGEEEGLGTASRGDRRKGERE
ncbi:hypothetical protein NSK_007476 [Nannochloropsis salina CCMP1776]|uniref:ABC transmembrane type-1 domain-containing protein n=1 Tax=Nannochloropsis salina CCMP1776 TaxID=1027361 RepID=A0A4D9CQ11_9STRA|nr:hypothetical protein NSK_007476 [Nannochloropsis salina CCMP1776]|eukprot:TFJ81210.1 hypothetical protein NSK_007476 [Nannochloropsis salina CCMP1776]